MFARGCSDKHPFQFSHLPSWRPQFWNTLQNTKKQQIVSERVRFAQHLEQMGFGHMEGFKLSKRTKSNEVANDVTYHTEDELMHLTHGNRARVEKIMAKAFADGAGLGCGYFEDPRLGETVRRACCVCVCTRVCGDVVVWPG